MESSAVHGRRQPIAVVVLSAQGSEVRTVLPSCILVLLNTMNMPPQDFPVFADNPMAKLGWQYGTQALTVGQDYVNQNVRLVLF